MKSSALHSTLALTLVLVLLPLSSVLAHPTTHKHTNSKRHNYALVCADDWYNYCRKAPFNYYCTSQGLPESISKNSDSCDRYCECVNISTGVTPGCIIGRYGEITCLSKVVENGIATNLTFTGSLNETIAEEARSGDDNTMVLVG